MIPVAALLACALLCACATVDQGYVADYDETDLWDSSLVLVRHIDIALLRSRSTGALPELSGFVSSVAARGDDLFFVDPGAGKLVHVSMASMQATDLASLRTGATTGLYVGLDGTVYFIDTFGREVVRLDPLHGGAEHIRVDPVIANPVDVAVLEDEHLLLVLDGLDGRIAVFDALGGLQQINEPRAFDTSAVLSARSISAGNGAFFLLDAGVDAVMGFSTTGNAVGSYGGDDLQRVTAMATDDCGRLFVTDAVDGSIYVGFADMSLAGRRVTIPELAGTVTTDLWTDGSFLFAATESAGIYVFLVDPECVR